ncbi:MAG: acetate/propionate family kinase [Polyangiaceae bacterium]
MSRRALSVNCGSSSLKLALFETTSAGEKSLERKSIAQVTDPAEALGAELADLEKRDLVPDVVGHRIVHGGPTLLEPTLVDAATLKTLDEVVPFAPLHLPAEIAAIRTILARWPKVPQVVSFDTSFHANLPELARRLPIPTSWNTKGVRRYGFHGLSYEYVVSSLGNDLRARTILAHLGSGASMVAVQAGKSVDTTMGFTPTGGLVMGTRSGDLDPGVLTYLLRQGLSVKELEDLLEHESGIVALSETTPDVRKLLARRSTDARAAFAIAAFCASAAKWIGALTTTLGGLDALIFTGGIGENSVEIRAEISARLAHLGIELDEVRNAVNQEGAIGGGKCDVQIVRTDEERIVARHAFALTSSSS